MHTTVRVLSARIGKRHFKENLLVPNVVWKFSLPLFLTRPPLSLFASILIFSKIVSRFRITTIWSQKTARIKRNPSQLSVSVNATAAVIWFMIVS